MLHHRFYFWGKDKKNCVIGLQSFEMATLEKGGIEIEIHHRSSFKLKTFLLASVEEG